MTATGPRCSFSSFAALLLVAGIVAASAVPTVAAAPPAPERSGARKRAAEDGWQPCTVCSGQSADGASEEEVSRAEACAPPKRLKTSSLSDLRTVACSYMQWAAFSMQHNASQTADELQNENDGLAGAIQMGLHNEVPAADQHGLFFSTLVWSDEGPGRCAVAMPENALDRPPATSFERSGGICSKAAVDVFGIPRQYAIFWSQQPVTADPNLFWPGTVHKVFSCVWKMDWTTVQMVEAAQAAYRRNRPHDNLSFDPAVIAACMVDQGALGVVRAVAAVVLEEGPYPALVSDGLMYYLDFDQYAQATCKWYDSQWARKRKRYIFKDCVHVLRATWPAYKVALMF